MTIEQKLEADRLAVIEALVRCMTLAPSNDTADTYHWIHRHAVATSLAEAVRWYAECAIGRDDHYLGGEDWKTEIARIAP